MVGARDMVFPLCQHAELLGLPARGRGAGLDLLRAWRAHRRPAGRCTHPRQILSGTPGQDWGIILMLAL